MKWIRGMMWFALVMFVLVSFTAVAQEVAAPTVTVSAGDTQLPSWLTLVINVLEGIFALAGTWLIVFLKNRFATNAAKEEALEALRVGVTKMYHERYKELKDKSADGTLTEAEKRELREGAISSAKEIATGPALQILKAWGTDVLHSLVERIVKTQKDKAPEKSV